MLASAALYTYLGNPRIVSLFFSIQRTKDGQDKKFLPAVARTLLVGMYSMVPLLMTESVLPSVARSWDWGLQEQSVGN